MYFTISWQIVLNYKVLCWVVFIILVHWAHRPLFACLALCLPPADYQVGLRSSSNLNGKFFQIMQHCIALNKSILIIFNVTFLLLGLWRAEGPVFIMYNESQILDPDGEVLWRIWDYPVSLISIAWLYRVSFSKMTKNQSIFRWHYIVLVS